MPRLLVVEDNTLMRKTLLETLQSHLHGTRVHEAVNGKEALKAAEELRPDLILMDIELPDSNGLDLTRRLKTRSPDLRVVLISLYDGVEYREAAAKNGADGFLSKRTASRAEIAGVVSRMLER